MGLQRKFRLKEFGGMPKVMELIGPLSSRSSLSLSSWALAEPPGYDFDIKEDWPTSERESHVTT